MLELLQKNPMHAQLLFSDALACSGVASPYLSKDELRALSAVASSERTLKVNTDLVREGAKSEQLYIITEGWACRYKTTREGGRQIVSVLVPGDVANLDALLFDRLDYAVRILSSAKAVALSRTAVLALGDRHAGIGRTLTRLAMVENAILSQWALCLGRRSAQQRVAHLFCELAVRLCGDDHETVSFEMPLTQEQLGDALGLTPVHVNRMMQQLRGDGLIVTSGRTMTLPDVAGIRAVADFSPAYLHVHAEDLGG